MAAHPTSRTQRADQQGARTMNTQPVATDQTCKQCQVAVLAMTKELKTGICFRCAALLSYSYSNTVIAEEDGR